MRPTNVNRLSVEDKIWCYACEKPTCKCMELRYGNGVPGLVGMYNLGNTCYINVIMQCLNNIKTISDFLLHWDMSVYHDSFVKNHDGFKLYTTLRSYLAQMSTTNTNVAPLRLVWRNNPSMSMTSSNQQQDAQEFFSQLMQQLKLVFSETTQLYSLNVKSPAGQHMTFVQLKCHVERQLKKINGGSWKNANNTLLPQLIVEMEPMLRNRSRSMMGEFVKDGAINVTADDLVTIIQAGACTMHVERKSFISEIVDGRFYNSIKCMGCKNVSGRIEYFQELSMAIPVNDFPVAQWRNGIWDSLTTLLFRDYQRGFFDAIGRFIQSLMPKTRDITIEDCLDEYFKTTYLSRSDGYRCDNCNEVNNAAMLSTISELPEILVLHLKRMQNDGRLCNAYVKFPVEGLDLSPYLHEDCAYGTTTYKLMSVIRHFHKLTEPGGHFVSYIRNPINDEWYLYDDTSVGRVPLSSVTSSHAYMLFYKKTDVNVKLIRRELTMTMESSSDNYGEQYVLSKKWLYKFNTFDEPGPIDNMDILCVHGSIKIDSAYRFWSSFKPVSREVWKILLKRFDGGPTCRVNEVKHCRICDVEELEDMSFAVALSWMDKWNIFIDNVGETPGPVENMGIFAGEDYEMVNYETWSQMIGLFGGGPELSNVVIRSYHNEIRSGSA